MSLDNAIQAVRPAEIPRALLAEQNLRLVPLNHCATTPGGDQRSTDFPLRDRADTFLLLHVPFRPFAKRDGLKAALVTQP
jgi:hypothetical protein